MVYDRVRVQAGAQVREQVMEQVCKLVGAQVRARVDDQVLEEVEERVGVQVWKLVGAQVRARVRGEVREQVRILDEQQFSEKEETCSTSELIWAAASYVVFVVYLILTAIGAIQKFFG